MSAYILHVVGLSLPALETFATPTLSAGDIFMRLPHKTPRYYIHYSEIYSLKSSIQSSITHLSALGPC
jgi:hypothetical protein